MYSVESDIPCGQAFELGYLQNILRLLTFCFFFQEQEAKRLREAADGAGILANIWGYFTGGANAKHECQSDLIQANVNANSDATIEANANNNAANRSVEENES